MEEKHEAMGTIRGTRYAVKLTKTVKGMPGFAPEYREVEVCDVVFKFPHGDGETYIQFKNNPPILEQTDIEQILEIMSREFKAQDFKFEEENKEY